MQLPTIQAIGNEDGNESSKEYEDPDYCSPGNEGLSVRAGSPNKDSGSHSYETIDIMKVDYVSVYSTPSDFMQNKTQ